LNPKQRRTLAVLASIAVLKGAAAGERQAIGRYRDDGAINSKVEMALQDERSLEASELVVVTEDRVVWLTGRASSQAHIDRAATVARAIGGVQSVRIDIHLKPN
jgi:osmotically-inducible protein OsmY